jgi:transcriptional regulator with XRE-family HTH domain
MGLMKSFAVNMKKARQQRQLSQEALAHRVGLCTSYVSMLERGQRSPPLDTIESIARALNVQPQQLLAK